MQKRRYADANGGGGTLFKGAERRRHFSAAVREADLSWRAREEARLNRHSQQGL